MTQAFTLIGLTGPKDCGKDTVASLLGTHAGFTRLAFGDALYHEVAQAYQIDLAPLRQRETKEQAQPWLALEKCLDDGFIGRMFQLQRQQGIELDMEAPRSPRQILQWWGTDYRRTLDVAYWVRKVSSHLHFRRKQGLGSRFVITDCRFGNEAAMVRNHGGLIWQVKRAGREVPVGSHISEVTGEGFKPDAIINNSHDIRHLQQLVLGEFWAHDAGLAGVTVEITV